MELALYAPGLGYYSAGSPRSAAAVTSSRPRKSRTSSAAAWRARAPRSSARPAETSWSSGAGTGAMAARAAHGTRRPGHAPRRATPSLRSAPSCAERQRARLATLPAGSARARRLARAAAATAFTASCLRTRWPMRCRAGASACARRRRGGARRGASSEAGEFMDAAAPADADTQAGLRGIRSAVARAASAGLHLGGVPAADPWLASLADSLEHGALLLFDYGLPRRALLPPAARERHAALPLQPARARGSATSMSACRTSPPGSTSRAWPRPALAAGLEVAGFSTQAAFLLDCGLEELRGRRRRAMCERARLAGEARRLIMPEEMGEAFKVMALTRGLDETPAGFALQDLRGTL